MSTRSNLERLADPPAQLAQTTQATAVEQARAIAEVQAAVVVAQQIPRDISRAVAEMKDSCGRKSVAERAFYSVPNRGNGPTVHLARELARIWGNIDYTVRELRRDDEAGMSEVLAMAWDQQTNVRSSRSFQVPHAKMAGKGASKRREQIVDLDDIYRNNQNVGAKAVRECIFSVLPRWFTEDAQTACRRTLDAGEGVPLPDRIARMVQLYAEVGVDVPRIEAKTRKRRGQWDAGDVAQLGIDFTSITRDGVDADSLFPPRPVTADELGAEPSDSSYDGPMFDQEGDAS